MAVYKPNTDFVAAGPSGLLVPPAFVKALTDETLTEKRRIDNRFFGSQRSGKYFSMLSGTGGTTTTGALEKPHDTPSFVQLRNLLKRSPLDRLIIGARLFQLRKVSRRALIPEKEEGWRVMHVRSSDPNFENTPEIEARCREMENIIQRVNTKVTPGGFRAFINAVVGDELKYDRKAMIIAKDEEGLPSAYWTVDPTTILPRIEVLAPWMKKNKIANVDTAATRMTYDLWHKKQVDSSGREIDLTRAAWVQILDGQIASWWSEDEIDIDIVNPQNEIDRYFYGRSIFEDSRDLSDSFNAAFTYNTGWFSSRVPENLIYLSGEVDDEGMDVFQKQVLGQTNPNDFHRVAFMSGDKDFNVQAVPLRQSMREMAFPAWIRLLIAMKCAAYRMDPRIINFDVASGNDQQIWKVSSREQQLTMSQEEGFHTIVMNLEDWLNRTLVAPRYPDLVVRWVGLDRPSEPDKAMLLSQKMAWESLDEIRAESGVLQPLAVPGYPELGSLPLNPTILQWVQLLDQKKMMAQQSAGAQGMADSANAGGEMAPSSPDEDGQAASGSAPPAEGGEPSSPGDVRRQSAAGGLQKSKRFSITID